MSDDHRAGRVRPKSVPVAPVVRARSTVVPEHAPPTPAVAGPLFSRHVLHIQRTLGNRAATAAVSGRERVWRPLGVDPMPAPGGRDHAPHAARAHRHIPSPPVPVSPRGRFAGPVVVQRHASWEHRLLGDVDPATLQVITTANEFAGRPYQSRQVQLGGGQSLSEANNQASHALVQQLDLLRRWQASPPPPGTTEWNGVRLVTINLDDGDQVVCSRGEMNSLADFYGSLAQLKRGRRDTMERILQTVRREAWNRISGVLGRIDPAARAAQTDPEFGGASHFEEGKAAELEMNAITADQRNRRSETYLANVARNACHFAPQSWFSWKQYHEQARELAGQAWAARQQAERENNESLRTVASNLANEAVVTNGFGDHYLQDSFAAGHLINKTLVMQWFVEWLGSQNLAERLAGTSAGSRWIRNWNQVRTMTHDLQPELAGLDLYEKPSDGQATDPQAAENQATRAERIARTGLSGSDLDTAYDNYHAFLNSAGIQAAAGELHDHFCREGLEVYAGETPVGYIYGDNQMISGGTGIEYSAETSQMSQKAIDDLNEGKQPVAVDEIMKRLPDHVRVQGRPMSLREWHTSGVLRGFCESTIFPRVPYRLAGRVPLAPFGVSQDVWGGSGPAQMGRVRNLLLEVARRAGQVRELAGRARDRVVSGARGLRDSAVSGARGLRDRVVSGARGLRDRVVSGARELRDGVVSGARGLRDGVVSGARGARDRVVSGARGAWDAVTGRTHSLTEIIRRRALGVSQDESESSPEDVRAALDDAVEQLQLAIESAREQTAEGLPEVPDVTQSAMEGLTGDGAALQPVGGGGGEGHDGPF